MLRALFLCSGMLAVAWLEFQVFPGHTYLQSGTQIYLPVLERLDTPGFLSRDLVATNPFVSYTIYDEVTLVLHQVGHLDFRTALTAQQFLFRVASLTGFFLLARATGLTDLFALLIATLVNLGAVIPSAAACLVDPEPVPRAFALGLTFLAMGLLAREKPLLSGLTAGFAVIYDPPTAAPFWIVCLCAFALDRKQRPLIRPMLPILLVFLLLLANMAQLQPGVTAGGSLFTKLSDELAQLQQYRTAYVWVSLWAARDIWHYLAISVLGLWAAARMWPVLNRQMRWIAIGVGLSGVLSVLVSYVLLDRLRLAVAAQIQPAKALIFTVALSSLLAGLAGMRAVLHRRNREAFCWFALVMALPFDTQILDFLRVFELKHFIELALCVSLAATLTLLLARFKARWRFAVVVVPLAGIFLMARMLRPNIPDQRASRSAYELANWAERYTWGSSMFLFPDAGRALYPGIFRAASRRALWTDWTSGVEVDYSALAGIEWWRRWQDTMQNGFVPARLEKMLTLPIDYYVLRSQNKLAGVRAAFTDDEFVAYDAEDLRNAQFPLRLQH